jgi:hypothetical protein
MLMRAAAADLRLGYTASASPVAQTLSVQDGSGTNIAGVTWTFRASRATGNAAGGAFEWHTSDVGSTGSTLQTATVKMRLLADGTLRIGTATNNTTVEPDGSLIFNGAATVFDDLGGDAIDLQQSGPGISLNLAEAQVEYLATSDLSDYMVKAVQLSHAWKVGSVVYPHVHWMQTTSSVPNFLLQYRWQRTGEAKVTSWTNLICNTAALSYSSGTIHNIAHTAAGITPPAGADISDIIQFRILRDTANTSAAFAGADPVAATVAVISFDVHVEKDRVGSRSEYTP